jgi:hypothetical protein
MTCCANCCMVTSGVVLVIGGEVDFGLARNFSSSAFTRCWLERCARCCVHGSLPRVRRSASAAAATRSIGLTVCSDDIRLVPFSLSSSLSIPFLNMSDNLRASISRETAATKLAVLRTTASQLDATLHTLQISQDELSDPWARFRVKASAISKLQIPQTRELETIAKAALDFIRMQEQYGTHPSVKLLERWNRRLDDELGFLKRRMEHGVVYADVIEEWLAKDGNEQDSDGKSSEADDESLDLPPLHTEPFNPQTYLTSQSIPAVLLEGIQSLASRATTFGERLLKSTITPQQIKAAMQTLARDARVYSPDVRKQLFEESEKKLVLEELAGAITQTWRSIGTWKWPDAGVSQSILTHMNGKKRAFLSVDIVQGIFLETVAGSWSRFFQQELKTLRANEGWPFRAELESCIAERDLEDVRRQLDLINLEDPAGQDTRGRSSDRGIIESRREALKNEGAKILGGGYDSESSYDGTLADSTQPDEPFTAVLDAIRPAKTYGDIFRLVTTDIVLARKVAPTQDLTILHGDLQDYGRSVPHDVLLSVLSFFGMPPAWIEWYKTYLRVPLIQPDGSVVTSTRGSPFGQSCSTLADELLLVILDIALAVKTGITAHRNHDDFWLWNLDSPAMECAWEVMQDFTAQTGLGWNGTKTSCTVVRGNGERKEVVSGLPTRGLRWGILELEETGKWKVDAQLIDEQADAAISDIHGNQTRSFLGIIGVFNKYQSYLLRNCGAPTTFNSTEYFAICRNVLKQYEERVTEGKGLAAWLRGKYLESFPDTKASDADELLQVWPLRLGGFGLHSFAPLALAYEQRTNASHPDDKHDETLPGPNLAPHIRTHEKMQQIWSTPALADTFDMSRNHDGPLGRWIRSKQQLPPLVTFETYTKWYIMHGSANLHVIQDAMAQIDLDPVEVEVQAARLYRGLLEEEFGEGAELVASELVPNYVIMDIEQRVKKLFT